MTLTATATGFTQAQGSATVGEPALLLGGVPATTTTLSTSTAFYVYLGVLNASGQFADYQPVRAGAASVTITGEQQQCGGGAAGRRRARRRPGQ